MRLGRLVEQAQSTLAALLASGAGAEPAVSVGPAPELPAVWRRVGDDAPAPTCFAYSRTRRAYACVGMSLEPAAEDKWVGTGFIDVVSLRDGSVESFPVWSNAGEAVTATAEVRHRLRGHAMTSGRFHHVTMTSGAWVDLGDIGLRYESRGHDGDASMEWFGELTIRCADRSEHLVDLRGRGMELGETAQLFQADAGLPFAVSVRGEDGGEGVLYYWLNTLVIDGSRFCRGYAGAIAGPAPDRRLGP